MTQPAVLAPDEDARLAALAACQILDTTDEPAFDALTRLAAATFDAPIALVSLVDSERQWFKSRVGLDATETPRDVAFCAHAILSPDQTMVVPDTSGDARFSDNPLVTGPPYIRFYAGVPLVTEDGHALGTLCVIDTEPRAADPAFATSLRVIATQAEWLIQERMRRVVAEREETQSASRSAELADELERRTQFLAEAHHKLKSPLSVIQGWCSLLDRWDELSVETRQDATGAIREASMRLSGDLDDILDQARAELLEARIRSEPVDLGRLVRDQIGHLESAHSTLDVTVDAARGTMAVGDPEALAHVVHHLVENAVKYSPDGGPITVELRRDGDATVLRVIDEGIGVPAEIDVFEPFSRGAEARSVARGTGLGLHVVRSLVTAMHGTVSARRRATAGSEFVVRLRSA